MDNIEIIPSEFCSRLQFICIVFLIYSRESYLGVSNILSQVSLLYCRNVKSTAKYDVIIRCIAYLPLEN